MEGTRLIFLGHASFLLVHGDRSLVVDPNLSARLGFVRRQEKAVFDPFVLREVGTILYTNPRANRFDHSTLKYFRQKTTAVAAPDGLIGALRKFHHFEVIPAEPGCTLEFGPFRVTPHARPHPCVRFFRLHRYSLDYTVKADDKTVFFASDGGFEPEHFRKIGLEGRIDVAVLPIDRVGSPVPASQFLSVDDAIAAFRELHAEIMVPNAFGAFVLPGRNPLAARRELEDRLEHDRELQEKVKILNPGEDLGRGLVNENPNFSGT